MTTLRQDSYSSKIRVSEQSGGTAEQKKTDFSRCEFLSLLSISSLRNLIPEFTAARLAGQSSAVLFSEIGSIV